MAQKIKVQDGIIAYSASDPTEALDLTVAGTVTVTNEITVGSVNSPIDGIISTGDGTALDRAQLDITTGAYGDLFINQSPTGGALFLNNAQWPTGSTQPAPGLFLGASDLNTLEYLPFYVGYQPNDSLTVSQLNLLYPDITPGQSVVGLTVVYMCVSTGQWRILGNATPTPVNAPPEEFVTVLSSASFTYSDGSYYDLWGTSTVLQESDECTVDVFGGVSPAVFSVTTPGIYKVTITGRLRSINYPEGPLPVEPMLYGLQVAGAQIDFDRSTHQSGGVTTPEVWPNNGFQNQIQWTDTFYVENYFGGATFTLGVYANTDPITFAYNTSCMVSVVRTNGSIWPNIPF